MTRHARTLCFLIVAFLLVTTSTVCFGQSETQGQSQSKIGISAAVQGQQKDFLVPIWFSDRFVLTPAFYFTSASDAYSDYGFGIAMRANLRTGKAVPYVGARIGGLFYSPSGGDTQSDVLLGPLVGGEYFLADHFSLGVEAQLNFALSGRRSQRFGDPDGTILNTATVVMATFYF